MFQSDAARLPMAPDEGMEVRVLGTLTLYEQRGDFQLKVRSLEGEGAGGLWRVAFEKLRRKLEQEGLLAPERKRPIPRHPATVGIVTSPVGAALHDILEVLRKRAPWTNVIFSPARVQGEGAARDVARALRLFARANVADVIIVGRGGGSTEDLWAFNEEIVARAIAASPIPIISAVGHEVDVTIADLVADARAPTPSAAAEYAVPDRNAILRELSGWDARLVRGLERRVAQQRHRLEATREDMAAAFDWRLREARTRLAALSGKLEALSPLAALRRGYSVVTDEAGHVLRTVASFEPDSRINVRVQDGVVLCRVESTESRGDEQ
jgi:exodeoxyribonuclease VII large subunit